MAFKLSKFPSASFMWTHSGVGKKRPKVEITPDDIENYVARGMTRTEIAHGIYKITYGYFNQRINASDSLSKAFKRGKEKLKTLCQTPIKQ